MTDEWKLVAIAASGDGIDDLHRVLQPLRPGIGAAIVVVVREPAEGPWVPFEEIARGLALPIAHAVDGARVVPGRIHLAPRGQRVTIDAAGRFEIDPHPSRDDTNLADRLFASAVQCFGARMVGVVMGGHGHDGTAGLRAIHRVPGAIGIVQSPADTAVPDAAIHAVLGDSPDYLPLVDDMGKLLEVLIRRPVPHVPQT